MYKNICTNIRQVYFELSPSELIINMHPFLHKQKPKLQKVCFIKHFYYLLSPHLFFSIGCNND